MESLMEWFANNGEALWATIISFFSAYGVALVSLIVAIIKAKLNAIAAQKASDKKLQELVEVMNTRMDVLESNVIKASNVNTEKRLDAMNEIVNEIKAANDALQPAKEITANDALESLQ